MCENYSNKKKSINRTCTCLRIIWNNLLILLDAFYVLTDTALFIKVVWELKIKIAIMIPAQKLDIYTLHCFTNDVCSWIIYVHILNCWTGYHIYLNPHLAAGECISLCHQYRTSPACTSTQYDQALLYSWLANLKKSHLDNFIGVWDAVWTLRIINLTLVLL